MYAIVDIAGQQFKVEKSQKLFVHRLEGNEGDKLAIDKVLLIDNEGKVIVDPQYSEIQYFDEVRVGWAKVKREGSYGFIDTNGKEVEQVVEEEEK